MCECQSRTTTKCVFNRNYKTELSRFHLQEYKECQSLMNNEIGSSTKGHKTSLLLFNKYRMATYKYTKYNK